MVLRQMERLMQNEPAWAFIAFQ